MDHGNYSPQFKKPAWKKNFLLYLGILALIVSFGVGLVVGEGITRNKYAEQQEKVQLRESANLDIVFEAWKKLSDKFVGKLPDEKSMVY